MLGCEEARRPGFYGPLQPFPDDPISDVPIRQGQPLPLFIRPQLVGDDIQERDRQPGVRQVSSDRGAHGTRPDDNCVLDLVFHVASCFLDKMLDPQIFTKLLFTNPSDFH
jgi:hypothetical protein